MPRFGEAAWWHRCFGQAHAVGAPSQTPAEPLAAQEHASQSGPQTPAARTVDGYASLHKTSDRAHCADASADTAASRTSNPQSLSNLSVVQRLAVFESTTRTLIARWRRLLNPHGSRAWFSNPCAIAAAVLRTEQQKSASVRAALWMSPATTTTNRDQTSRWGGNKLSNRICGPNIR